MLQDLDEAQLFSNVGIVRTALDNVQTATRAAMIHNTGDTAPAACTSSAA